MKSFMFKQSGYLIMGTVLCCTHNLLSKSKKAGIKETDSAIETLAPKESKIFKNPIVKEYVSLAKSHHKERNYEKALEFYTKALSLDEYNFNALMGVATIAFMDKEFSRATEYYETILTYYPRCTAAHYNLGLCYLQNKQYEKSIKELQKTVSYEPSHYKAWCALGTCFETTQDYTQALEAYKKAVSLEPKFAIGYFKLGVLYKNNNDLLNASINLEKAKELDPENNQCIMELANVFNCMDENEKALPLYLQILEADHHNSAALYNCGFTLKKKGHIAEAIAIYKKVIEQDPLYARAHFALAHALLAQGNFKEGLKEYEWRFAAYDEDIPLYPFPLWDGSDLQNKKILVWAEQGLGDTLQFVRYLPILAQQGATVIFQAQNNLKMLLKDSPSLGVIIERNDNIPVCDFHVPLMSLPYFLKTTLETIPATIPYLNADKHLTAYWHSYLAHDSNLKIGICWHGNGRYNSQALQKTVEKKSIPLSLLAQLAAIPGVTLYSLQRFDGLDQCKEIPKNLPIHYFGAEFDILNGSFRDSAAVIKNLDLVISADTSIGHLAGALGARTWIVLPQPADWRWLEHRCDSPWYPTVRLFRQKHNNDWDSVLSLLKHNVQLLVNDKKRALDIPKIDSLDTQLFDHDATITALFDSK